MQRLLGCASFAVLGRADRAAVRVDGGGKGRLQDVRTPLVLLAIDFLAVLTLSPVLRLARPEEEVAEEESSPVDNLFGPSGKSS